MAFSVGTLPAYVEQNERALFMASLFDAKTQSLIQSGGNVMSNVKSAETVNVMATDAAFQDDSDCGFNASGTTTFTQRTLTVGNIKVQEALCPKNLEASFLQKALPGGTNYTEMVFAADYTSLKAAKIAEQLETAIWQGVTSSSNINLNKFNGFQAIVDGSAVDANTSAYISGGPITGITSSNALAVVRAVKNALPARVKGKADVKIFCGWDTFDALVDGHVIANYFNYGSQNIGDGEFTIPGTQYKVVAVHGLDGTGDLYAMRLSNMFLGTDLISDEKNFEMWYSLDDRNVKFSVALKIGVQVAFPTEVVKFKA